jgi:16S rRNA (cytosine967-C5)-methyltransferase
MRKLQKLAAGALEDVLAGAALHQVLPRYLQQMHTPGERGALQDIVYGSLRQLVRLDAWLEALLERPLTDPQLGWLLRVALYQLAYTRAPAHAVVHNAVTAAGQGWRRGLANAVLRNFQRRRAEVEIADEPSARWSHPDWWIAKLQAEYPAHWQAILEASLQHPPFTLRVNCRHGDVASYLQRLTEAGLPAHQTGPDAVTLDKAVSVHSLPGFDQGLVSVQDAGAQWAARLLDAQPGERVLDACAAPGGKTGHILGPRRRVALTALDVDASRLWRVQENLDRLQLAATLVEGDARSLMPAGRPAVPPDSGRRAVQRLRCRAPQPRHQVAAASRRYRSIFRPTGRYAGGTLAAAGPGWYIALRHLLGIQ